MGVLIGSEGKIYFPLKDANKFGYDNYFKNPKKAKELHEKYSGPEAKKKAYEFLGVGDMKPKSDIGPKSDMEPKMSNVEAKASLEDNNIWKSYYFPF